MNVTNINMELLKHLFSKEKINNLKLSNFNCLNISKVIINDPNNRKVDVRQNSPDSKQKMKQRMSNFLSDKNLIVDKNEKVRNQSSNLKLRKFRLVDKEQNNMKNLNNGGK